MSLTLFKKKLTLKKLSTEDIIKEKSVLEREMSTINKQIQAAEYDKQQLLLKGVRTSSQAEKLGYAQQIRIKDFQVKALQKVQYPVTQKLVVLNGLQVLKKNQEILDKMGQGLFNRLDIDTLSANIEDIVVGQDINFEKLSQLAGAISEPIESQKEIATDSQVTDIMMLMDTLAQNPEKESEVKVALDRVLNKAEASK